MKKVTSHEYNIGAGEAIRSRLSVTHIHYNIWYFFYFTLDLVCCQQKDLKNKQEVQKALQSSVMSKQYGHEEFLSKLISDACGE